MKALLTAILTLGLALSARADDKKSEEPKGEPAPPPKVKAEEPPAPEEEERPAVPKPPLELVVSPGEATATPHRKGVSWANGGIIDVTQPNPTTIIVTMSGICATNADLVCRSVSGYHFDLNQMFSVCFHSRRVKSAHLTLEGRVIGQLRTNHETYVSCLCKKGGVAETEEATASIRSCDAELVTLALPGRSSCCGDDLSVYNHEGPLCVPVLPGKYTLHENWGFSTAHPPFFCRGASAEFAPQPEYCPDVASAYWFQHFRPFNGVATRDFGFQVTIKLVAD